MDFWNFNRIFGISFGYLEFSEFLGFPLRFWNPYGVFGISWIFLGVLGVVGFSWDFWGLLDLIWIVGIV